MVQGIGRVIWEDARLEERCVRCWDNPLGSEQSNDRRNGEKELPATPSRYSRVMEK
jgi:hypothetical protein